MKAKKKKAPSLPALKNKLDTLFSKYIRMRDAGHDGLASCITCGRYQDWKEMDCGHFVSRQNQALRWHESNAHAQCRYCNRFRVDQYIDYTLAMQAKYGEDAVEDMLAERCRPKKFTRADLQEMIDYYAEKLSVMVMGQVRESEGHRFWRENVS